ncbi:hypothetical protein GVN21_19025 [Caulobacter sp. SLTY]|uniref:GcrA family cell cycle regulator n=1 Tax=Caulobacter sp. SLTY TaxID=2683262 RepID=UPI001411E60A|nr:GcrA family cell cycle regulator [Caulobacter sp. SLTY]NBB17458.1 hypothetical protein [Caulobacter sp. SLTY]
MHSEVLSGAAPARRPQWPSDRLAQLRGLFEGDLTHQAIAERMGLAKGAVSAKISRLGWRRGETVTPAAMPAVATELIPETGRFKRLEALKAGECHWPTVEDAQGVQLFCGCRRADASSYCAGHLSRAHRRPRPWERQALEPARRPPPKEGLGWDRFADHPA